MNEEWSEQDIDRWLHSLAQSRGQQKKVILDLLRHALGDEMTGQDVAVCRRALQRLDQAPTEPQAKPSVKEALVVEQAEFDAWLLELEQQPAPVEVDSEV